MKQQKATIIHLKGNFLVYYIKSYEKTKIRNKTPKKTRDKIMVQSVSSCKS